MDDRKLEPARESELIEPDSTDERLMELVLIVSDAVLKEHRSTPLFEGAVASVIPYSIVELFPSDSV